MAQPTALVLGTGVDGTTPCVLLEDGPHRLLLNATEGLQRLAGEHRLKLHRGLDAVLLSSLEPTAVAGLPGLLLTLAQAGVARLHVCGPPGTATYLSTLRPFARTGTMAVQATELDGSACVLWRARLRVLVLPVAEPPVAPPAAAFALPLLPRAPPALVALPAALSDLLGPSPDLLGLGPVQPGAGSGVGHGPSSELDASSDASSAKRQRTEEGAAGGAAGEAAGGVEPGGGAAELGGDEVGEAGGKGEEGEEDEQSSEDSSEDGSEEDSEEESSGETSSGASSSSEEAEAEAGAEAGPAAEPEDFSAMVRFEAI